MNSDELSAYIDTKYKKEYEPTGHWLARKEFLLRNWADYPERQVVCLSMVWSNIEYDGATYAPELMERVKNLASGLDLHAYTDSCLQPVTKPRKSTMKRPAPESINEASLSLSSKIRKQADHSEVPSVSRQTYSEKDIICEELPGPLKSFISKLPSQSSIQRSNAVEIFYISASKARIHPDFDFTERTEPANQAKKGKKKVATTTTWTCTLYIGDLQMCSAENSSKVEAKRDCFDAAIRILFNPGLCVKHVNCVGENGRKHTSELCIGNAANHFSTGSKNKSESIQETANHKIQDQITLKSSTLDTVRPSNIDRSSFGSFILVESSTHENPITTLMCSAARNKVDLEFEISDTPVSHNGETGYLGTFVLGGKPVARAVNQEKKAVKRAVAEAAVNELRMCCFTIKTRFHEHDTAQSNAVSMEAAKTEEQDSTKITSGIGMQLLKKMGWSGEGGLGKKGQGRAEPVMVEQRSHREGFGTAVAAPTDIAALKEMVKNYATGGREDDLVFSSDLTSEQRKVLHTACRKFNLKSSSYGKDEDRYLIVSRKRDVHQLAQYIAKNGGATLQYTLVPPSPN